MSYTQAEIRAFVMDAVIAGPVTPGQLSKEASNYRVDIEEMMAAARELREANWIEYQAPYYQVTVRGLIHRGMLPEFTPIQPVDLTGWVKALEGPIIPNACSMAQLRVLRSRICGGSND